MLKKIFSVIKIIRPLNVISSGIAILFSSQMAGYQGSTSNVLLAIFVVIFFTIGANVLNDYFDHEIDRVNRPDRAIIVGDVTRIQALYISIFSFVAGVFLSLQLNFNSQILSIFVSLPLLIFYNAKAKNYPLVGNVIVALILGLSFIYAGIVFENIKPLIVPALLAFGLTLIREIVKDIADLEGDKIVGARTFPIIFGSEKAVYLCTFLSAILGCLAFILFLNGYYNFYYGILLIITVEIPLAVVVISLLNKPNAKTAKKGAKLLKFCTLGGLFSIYIGTI
jgi:4-hydroxybenzoate polyprenyltransferase